MLFVDWNTNPSSCFLYRKMTNDNNSPIDTTDVATTPLNVATTDATVTTVGNITASTAAATTSTILPAGNVRPDPGFPNPTRPQPHQTMQPVSFTYSSSSVK